MELSTEVLRVILFLVPGLVTIEVFRFLTVAAKREIFDTVVQALVFTLLDMALFRALDATPLGGWEPLRRVSSSDYWRAFHDQGGGLLLIAAAGVGVAVAFATNRNAPYRLLRRLQLTTKGGAVDVWNEVFQKAAATGWVLVTLKDGRRYLGWPASYSTELGVHEVYLTDAAQLDDAGNEIAEYSGILLTRSSTITSVQIVPAGARQAGAGGTGP